MDVKLSSVVAPSFKNLHIDLKKELHTHYWLKGGRGSTKSSCVSVEIILGIMKDPKANALALRKVKDTLKDSVFEQLQWAISALKVDAYWHITHSPLTLTYIPTGQKIIFRGADNPQKIKSTKVSKGYIKYIWYEECDEFDGMEEIRNINQSLMRGGSKFVVFYSFNPPKSIKSWINQEIEVQKLREDAFVHHSTYLSVPKEWLGNAFVIEAEHLKKTKSKAYQHEYLGEAVGTGGEIFDNVKLEKITDEELQTFDNNRFGQDWGYAVDPFAFVGCHYDSTRRRLYIYDEIYKVGLSNRLAASEIKSKYEYIDLITADSAEPKSIAEMNDYGLNVVGAKKGPGSIEFGIKWLTDLEAIIIDPERCPNTAREFTSYELEKDKSGNFKSKYPDKDNHTIDATRYALEADMVERQFRITRL